MQVNMIEDSINKYGIRLSTLHLRYWRPIHAELITHRVFSRNARSSRAVPVVTLLQEETYMPHFMQNKPGMQATEEMDEKGRKAAETVWAHMADVCRDGVEALHSLGVHKQWANRPLEWFGYIDVLVSSTCWTNFWELRIDSGAQPEIRELAELMKRVMDHSDPTLLRAGEWHLPYITADERKWFSNEDLAKISAARCARLSYKPFDGRSDVTSEFARYEKLMVSRPVHASPAEHQATPDRRIQGGNWLRKKEHGNFVGWRQHRKLIPHEAIMEKF